MSDIDDGISNPSTTPSFHDVLGARLSRRSILGGGLAATATAMLGVDASLNVMPAAAGRTESGPLVGFAGVANPDSVKTGGSATDTVVIPAGYTAEVLVAWGDPVSDGPAFVPDASNSSADQARQWGMHNDGMVYFPLRGSAEGLLVVNSEYTDDGLLFADGVTNWTAEKTKKSQNAHGVNIIQVSKRQGGQWRVVRPSQYARRVTAQTPIDIAGPVAGDDRLKTQADATGRRVLGTLNNCAMGFTPWGTYLACEENFNGYFFKTVAQQNQAEVRYGISAFGSGTRWHTTDARFNADQHPNEPNRFGWVTEIDPFAPASTPKKRTALGRIKHEGAWVQEARDGRVVVYSGDDERSEYIYRYVSADRWRRMIRNGESPLDRGTLYVARFDADGTGRWLPLTPDNPAFAGKPRPNGAAGAWTLADILIYTRLAADVLEATRMDRPEWIDTFPDSLTGIVTLTNNSRRGRTGSERGFPFPATDAANPRGGDGAPGSTDDGNEYGHIVTWTYRYDWTEDTFSWDIFALAGDPAVPAHGSTIVGDKYGSPDGIYVAPSGRLWIQTDVSTSTIGDGAYEGFGNNQMLCADPATRETRRFLVGPNQCEVTGVFVTPDERTMFVGIQHPGETPDESPGSATTPGQFSTWPTGGSVTTVRPRSSVLVITKDDGGPIGS